MELVSYTIKFKVSVILGKKIVSGVAVPPVKDKWHGILFLDTCNIISFAEVAGFIV